MAAVPEKLLKPYDPKETEERIYQLWEESGFFNPDKLSGEPFTIIMPPINANGSLHAGHGLVMTIEDIMIRYKRMRGFKTLWLPGLDHAGFETQVVYEKELERQGRSRFGMEHDKLYREILEFTLENSKKIKSQIRKMGASCDWSREKFTLDPEIVKTVHQTFKKLYDDGLIYRGKRIVNWCPKHATSLSELETEDVEQVDPLYYLKYGPFTIATARPETKFGDKYVVVHPDDARYKKYKHGEKIEVEWINGPVTATVIKDESIDMEFGTGAMTITPWHDPADFEIAGRHDLDKEQIIDWNGRLLPVAGEFAGLSIAKARPLIVEKLKSKNLLAKIEKDYKHSVKKCYKCLTPIEPQIKDQWFLKMQPLAEKATAAIEEGKVKYTPDHFRKITLHWLNNIQDWNISRQIVWGIPIPVWYHDPVCIPIPGREKEIKLCEPIVVGKEMKDCPHCAAKYTQDPDTLDTWFSSGQWPYAALKAQNNFPIMGWHSSIVPEFKTGKSRTYRLRDHEFKIGNKVLFEDSGSLDIFGFGIITNVTKTQVGKIKLPDALHSGKYKTTPELIQAFKRMYPEKEVTEQTTAWIYDFEFHSAKELKTDLITFFPTDVMETAGDIVFFWVARMIMLSLYTTGKIPFHTVYIHGMVLDAKGEKMSKSKGNVVDPIKYSEEFGTDALRLGLVIGNTPGTSLALSPNRIRGYKNFANKLWNITRFVLENSPEAHMVEGKLTDEFKNLTEDITSDMENFRFHLAAEKLYHYIWHRFADEIIEESKKNPEVKASLGYIWENCLKLLHPFMPFVTEEIWQILISAEKKQINPDRLLMVEKWPHFAQGATRGKLFDGRSR